MFRSIDGGLNWTLGVNSNGDARSLVLDTTSPANARILYAGISNRGVFQSTDGGQNWTQILNNATPAVAGALGGGNFSKVLVALAPATSPPASGGIQVLYVSLSGPNPGNPPPPPPPTDPVGFFISTDQGATWMQQAGAGIPMNTQGGYSFHMAVDPASPGDGVNDIIYIGAVGHARSADSGASFTALNGLHADNHAWAFAPQPGGTQSTVFCGNDGGIYRSDDNGTTWNPLNAGGLQTGLFYNMAIRPDATASVTLGTMQDNGTQTTSGAVSPGWNSPQGGDGWDVAYDGVTPGRAYATSGFWPAPCTRLFISNADGTDLPPFVPSAADITPWGTTTDQGCYLASVATDPSAAGIVYVSGNQNLWQSRDGGTTWNIISPFPTGGLITARMSVAPSNGNNVVVAFGNQVSVSTNALGPVPNITFTNITRNLPNRNVLRAVFDPNDPTVIYAVLGGFSGTPSGPSRHVFRTTIGDTTWTDISPELDVPFGAIALDGDDTPTTIYVGTDLGVLRSIDQGETWYVLDDIRFPRAPVTDMEIGRGSGILRVATYGRGVFEFTQPDGPAITVNLENGFEFGTVCEGPHHLMLQVFNVGVADLRIKSVQRLLGSSAFEVEPFPSTPLIVAPGEEIGFTVRFTPTTPGLLERATIRITSNDPGAPELDLCIAGTLGIGSTELAIADNGNFGEVCLGSFVDRDLVINNSGDCPLTILTINSSSPEFVIPGVFSFPLIVSAGGEITVPLRFQPSSLGSASATISVISNDPTSPAQIRVEGLAPPPRLVLSIADAGDFGKICIGDFHDLPLTLSNSGRCPLTITGISSSSPEFIVPNVISSFPLIVDAGNFVELNLRFQPTSLGDKAGTITINSDDPASPHIVEVKGTVGSGKLAVTGSSHFGKLEYGARALQTLTLVNVGHCNLNIMSAKLTKEENKKHHKEEKHEEHNEYKSKKCSHLCLLKTPFPAKLPPGDSIDIILEFHAKCDCAWQRKLIIRTDDPENPEQEIIVSGGTRPSLIAYLYCWKKVIKELWHSSEHDHTILTDTCEDEEEVPV
ncbi:MAG: choice-of-anchor D domain-containing protein [Cyanobacteria bacterium P01_F01_bin.3]